VKVVRSTITLRERTLKIYEYDNVDKKNYEVSLSSVNTYQIQVASSEETLQRSIKNIETYLQKLDIVRGYYASIENKLLNLQRLNLLLKDNSKETENFIRGVDLASSYSNLLMEKFKSQMTDFVIVQAFQIPQLVLRILK
jgi:flagellin-like hook-associated protein FlgL